MNRRVELNHMPRPNRRLFIVDIENAVGEGRLTNDSAQTAVERIKNDHKVASEDLAILGVSYSRNAHPALFAWPGARLVFNKGKDGADMALKNVLVKEDIAKRFSEVVIVSGVIYFRCRIYMNIR